MSKHWDSFTVSVGMMLEVVQEAFYDPRREEGSQCLAGLGQRLNVRVAFVLRSTVGIFTTSTVTSQNNVCDSLGS